MTRSTRPKLRKTGRTEAQVLAQVLDAARLFGLRLERRNVGLAFNPKGQAVRFGTPGDSDLYGVLPDGRALAIEVKAEGFDPRRLRGVKAAHFTRQLARLREVNALGGVGFWTDAPEELPRVFRRLLDGWRVEIGDDGVPWLTPPTEGTVP